MLGLVPVNIIGSVEAGDCLFASKKVPGVAVSETHPSYSRQQQSALVAHAVETKKCRDHYEV